VAKKQPNGLAIAQMMIRRHGLRAQAVAEARIAEMRQQGNAAGLEFWQNTNAAIRELRRTAALYEAAEAAA
jgi:hypothetical protein